MTPNHVKILVYCFLISLLVLILYYYKRMIIIPFAKSNLYLILHHKSLIFTVKMKFSLKISLNLYLIYFLTEKVLWKDSSHKSIQAVQIT